MLLKNFPKGSVRLSFHVKDDLQGGFNVGDIGSLALKCDDRIYVLDPYETYYAPSFAHDDTIEVWCKLEEDKDTFPDGYTLTVDDLLSENLKAEFYCEIDSEDRVSDIELSINFGRQKLTIFPSLEN